MNAQPATINMDLGPEPELGWVEISAIRVDENYQRNLRESRVRQILREFDWAHFQPVSLALHEDGTYTVFDGQHRVEAARRHPLVKAVPASIVKFDESFAEAQAFIGVNINRTAITHVERYYAGLEAGDERMMAICAVLEEAGCEVVPLGTKSPAPNRTSAIKSLERAIKLYGDNAVTQALLALRLAWPKDPGALNGSLIQVLARLFKNNRKQIEPERLVTALRGKSRLLLVGDAEALRKIGGGDSVLNLCKAVVEAYNRGLHKGQITIGAK